MGLTKHKSEREDLNKIRDSNKLMKKEVGFAGFALGLALFGLLVSGVLTWIGIPEIKIGQVTLIIRGVLIMFGVITIIVGIMFVITKLRR